MDAYTSFASVYDEFMDNVPYEDWAEYLCGLLKEYGVKDGLVLDLGFVQIKNTGMAVGTLVVLFAIGYVLLNKADKLNKQRQN